MEHLQGHAVMAADGPIGVVHDVYFDARWFVRYLAIHAGVRFWGRHILIPAKSLGDGHITRECISLGMSSEQVREAVNASNVGNESGTAVNAGKRATRYFPMRSAQQLAGYKVTARDGPIGRVQDFLVDDRDWCVTELVADTRSWLPGKPILISPDAVDRIEPNRFSMRIRLTREEVERSPRAH